MKYLLIFLSCLTAMADVTSLSNLRLESAYLTPGEVDKITVDITMDYGVYRRSEYIFIAVSDTSDFSYYSYEVFAAWKDGEEGINTRFNLKTKQPKGTRYIRVAVGWSIHNLVDITPATPPGDPWSLSAGVTINDGTAPVKLVFYDTIITTETPIMRWSGGGPNVLTVDIDYTTDVTGTWLPGTYTHTSFLFNNSGKHSIDLSSYDCDIQLFFRIRGVLQDNSTTDFTGTSVIYSPIEERSWNIPWCVGESNGDTQLVVMSPHTGASTQFRIGMKEDVPPPYTADISWRYLTVYPGEMFIQNIQDLYGFSIQGRVVTVTATEPLDVIMFYDTFRFSDIPVHDSWTVPEGSTQDWKVPVRGDINHKISIVISNNDTRAPGYDADVGWTLHYKDLDTGVYGDVSGGARIQPHKNYVIFLESAPGLPSRYIGTMEIRNLSNIPIGVVQSSKNVIDGDEIFTFMSGVQVK